MKCGECHHWYNDDGGVWGVCLFDQVERRQACECKHPSYLNPDEPDDDTFVPEPCRGCKHIAFRIPYASMFPCGSCSRAYPTDYFEPIEKHDE